MRNCDYVLSAGQLEELREDVLTPDVEALPNKKRTKIIHLFCCSSGTQQKWSNILDPTRDGWMTKRRCWHISTKILQERVAGTFKCLFINWIRIDWPKVGRGQRKLFPRRQGQVVVWWRWVWCGSILGLKPLLLDIRCGSMKSIPWTWPSWAKHFYAQSSSCLCNAGWEANPLPRVGHFRSPSEDKQRAVGGLGVLFHSARRNLQALLGFNENIMESNRGTKTTIRVEMDLSSSSTAQYSEKSN